MATLTPYDYPASQVISPRISDRVSKLQRLRDAKTLDDVARLLGFTPSGLSYILFKLPDAAKYNRFEIPKRSGGKRLIKAPEPRLSLLQRRLANLLGECLEELKKGTWAENAAVSMMLGIVGIIKNKTGQDGTAR